MITNQGGDSNDLINKHLTLGNQIYTSLMLTAT